MRRLLIASTVLVLATSWSRAQSTAFTYQGELKSNGMATSGAHDFRFRLFDAASGGAAIGSQVCADNVPVTDGKFSASIDFGSAFATTAGRFLEIEVRRDTGLNCGSAAGFVILTPRQAISPTPLATHAHAAFALDAPNGTRPNAILVSNSGNVGVNTPTPLSRLHVTAGSLADGIRVSGTAGSDPSISLFEGTTARGTLGLALATGNFSADASSGDIVLRAEPGRRLLLQCGLSTSALAITSANNIGLGTATPAAKLDVRGDIRLGPNGQFRATAGEENLRIVRGVVGANGSILAGSGFTISHLTEGQYTITFATPFSGAPALTATPHSFGLSDTQVVMTAGVTTTSAVVFTHVGGIVGGGTDMTFHFIAIGPR